MAKKDKNKKEEDAKAKGGGGIPPTFGNLAAIFLGGGRGAAAYGVAEVLKHEDFLTKWQRSEGEPILSSQNLAKAVAVLASLGIYKHIDPFPGSRVDNYAVIGLAAYLLLLLGIPQQSELGGRLAPAEAPVLIACLKHLKKEDGKAHPIHEIMEWLGTLPNRQEQKILQIFHAALAATADNAEEQKLVADMLADKDTRDFLTKFYGREPMPKDIKDGLQAIKEFYATYWPETKKKLLVADAYIAKTIKENIRPWLEENGVINNKPEKRFAKFIYWLGK